MHGTLCSGPGGKLRRRVSLRSEAAELEKFLEDYDEFKTDIGSMIGNLTCVLTKMDMLDSSLQVNLKLWTTDIWQQMNLKKTLAGEDPEWRQKLISGYTDCYQVASNWPQQSLDRNPITKVFGRHMIFFKCSMKQEKKMCGMAQMYSWLTTLYGNSDDFNWSQFGLPTDKYDRLPSPSWSRPKLRPRRTSSSTTSS